MYLPEVISIGNMLVEVMRTDLDQPLNGPGMFVGPFPSGDTAIYIDTIGRLGRSAGFIGAIGADDFGKCLLDRFARDGVDSSQVRVLQDHTTGVAFVAYFGDGSRKFIFHWRHSAAGQLAPDHVQPAYFARARWLHLTGCNLAVCESSRQACLKAMECLPTGAHLSFDPNIRPEVLSVEEIRDLCRPVIERADVVLPSLGEAMMFTGASSDEAGCRQWAAARKLVVLKQGAAGCTMYAGDTIMPVSGYDVEEIDPTGAGDSFSAGITVGLLEEMSLHDLGRFANAVGALAVTKKGPMEGAPTRDQVRELMAQQPAAA